MRPLAILAGLLVAIGAGLAFGPGGPLLVLGFALFHYDLSNARREIQ